MEIKEADEIINKAYQELLGRPPDKQGRWGKIQSLMGGMLEDDMRRTIMLSKEFTDRHILGFIQGGPTMVGARNGENIFEHNIKVIIGIPTYNGAYRLDWLLQSINKSKDINSYIDYKIIVCDDSGNQKNQEKTRYVIDKWSPSLPVTLIINDKNIGVPKSWNRIIRSEEDSKYIILINDDVIVKQDWLTSILYFLENNKNVGAAFYEHRQTDENDIPKILTDHQLFKVSKFDAIPIRCMDSYGCFFGFSRENYNIIGGFDENYFAYLEESDFATSLAARGVSNYILKYPICYHIGSATFKSAPEINRITVYKNSLNYYTKKWNGPPEITNDRYMSKIPPQKLKWIHNDTIYEG